MEKLLKNHAEKFRYLIVGVGNTVLDFILLFLFVGLGLDKIPANFISTGITMVISFFVNKSFTFKDNDASSKRKFVLFILITMTGLWLLQPILIWIVSSVLDPYVESASVLLFIAKLIATGGSLVWNYLLYSRVVFKKKES